MREMTQEGDCGVVEIFRRPVSRRTAIKVGIGAAAGTGLAVGGLALGASPAAATQVGAELCDNAGDSAAAQGLGSADLCIPYHRCHDNTWGYIWGDSFAGMDQANGTYLGSPVMLCQQSFDATGGSPISFTWAMPRSGDAAQLFSYTHNADNGWGYEVSRIPNDCIEIHGRTFIQYTSVNNWNTGDGSLLSGIAYSDDYGVTWNDLTGWRWDGSARGIDQSLYMMWSFAGIDADGWLYVFSKRWNGSHRNAGDGGAIQLFRFQPDDFYNGNWSAQQNWAFVNGGWTWTDSGTPPSIILQGNDIGEFSVKNIGGTYCMSYFDVTDYSIRTRTASRPDAVWTAPTTQLVGDATAPGHQGLPQVPTLYGGYVHPGSASASSLTLIVSQWDGTIGSRPYWALQYDGINP
jgi:hypothetical protein